MFCTCLPVIYHEIFRVFNQNLNNIVCFEQCLVVKQFVMMNVLLMMNHIRDDPAFKFPHDVVAAVKVLLQHEI